MWFAFNPARGHRAIESYIMTTLAQRSSLSAGILAARGRRYNVHSSAKASRRAKVITRIPAAAARMAVHSGTQRVNNEAVARNS